MSIVLYHHPFSRAANALWMLEELGVPHELRWVDIMKGEQKKPEIVALNPMGKVPILVDGDTVVTEGAAIALYLADRYSYGTLAPRADDPRRGTYLRWTLFTPSVIEPAVSAKLGGWTAKEGQVGWGGYDAVLSTIELALKGDYLLGDTFSMADVVLGGTLGYLLMVKAIEPREAFTAYSARLAARPASKRANERNVAIAKEHGLSMGR